MTPNSAFNAFLGSLELTPGQRQSVINQHTYLRTQLQQRMHTVGNFLTGSYARSTAIRPLNDIDLFLVLDPAHHSGPGRGTPNDCLREVQAALDAAYPNKELPILQSRSVNIEFSGTGVGYDVVPAFAHPNDEVFIIPDRDANAWIHSNPKIHQSLSTQANERAGKMLKPLTKAAKHWNYRMGKPLRSFHLEVMAWDIVTSKPASWLEGLATLFEGLAARVLYACPDPAGLGPRIDSVKDPAGARARLREASVAAREACTFDAEGQHQFAHFRLRQLFSPEYPEKGLDPDQSPAGGTDGSGSRFG
ncbi:MAG: nucleotidyltransferase [Alphaproteobacteria bacterium]|nr:nucleotidyltransferase [Alphaproteobacteria bacterium]